MSHLAILRSPLLSEVADVRHALFGRRGGTSSGVYDSLNVGLGSKDDPSAVKANRARAAAALGVEADALFTAYQIHSARAVEANGPWAARPEADAVVKGQTASSSYKPAMLENGVKTSVPPFVESGTRIVVKTADGSYVERAKD